VPSDALACPYCQQLVHAQELKVLAAKASEAMAKGDRIGARDIWQNALSLIPESAPEYQVVLNSVRALSREIATGPSQSVPPASDEKPAWVKRLGPFGAIGVLLLKFKWAALFFLTKGKLLLLGLTNFKALLSVAAFLGIYWALFGWWFALGFVLSIAAHEMGHYITVRRYGFSAELPVFIPGIAAYVRWQGAGVDPVVRARISLAGPLFGLFAALISYGVYQSTGHGVWLAVAHTGAWINLLNLIPVMIFDGASAMNALGKQERIAVLVVSLAMWGLLGENLFLFVALATGYRLYKRDFPAQSSHTTAYYYIALMIALGALSYISYQSAGAMRATHAIGGEVTWMQPLLSGRA
jgi:Zn-dependent protease